MIDQKVPFFVSFVKSSRAETYHQQGVRMTQWFLDRVKRVFWTFYCIAAHIFMKTGIMYKRPITRYKLYCTQMIFCQPLAEKIGKRSMPRVCWQGTRSPCKVKGQNRQLIRSPDNFNLKLVEFCLKLNKQFSCKNQGFIKHHSERIHQFKPNLTNLTV